MTDSPKLNLLDLDRPGVSRLLFGHVLEGPVVEDVAVLVHLDEG